MSQPGYPPASPVTAAGGTPGRAGVALAGPPRGWSRFTPLGLLAALSAAFAYVLAANPTDTKPDPLGGCGWYMMFHTNGPFCGGTRMVWYLLHGNIVGAARSHLLALIGVPFAGYAFLAWTAAWVFGARIPRLRLPWPVYAGYAAAFVVFATVLRNLPGFEWFHLAYMQPGIGL